MNKEIKQIMGTAVGVGILAGLTTLTLGILTFNNMVLEDKLELTEQELKETKARLDELIKGKKENN